MPLLDAFEDGWFVFAPNNLGGGEGRSVVVDGHEQLEATLDGKSENVTDKG